MATMPNPIAAMPRMIVADEPFACAACGHDDAGSAPVVSRSIAAKPFELWRCSGCGLVQQHPKWSPSRTASLYGDDCYFSAETEEHRWARAVQHYIVHLAPIERTWRARPGTLLCRGLRLLDVGCAFGHLAVLAKHRGWRVTGIDVHADAVSQAAVRFGLDVRAGSLSSHADTLAPFDVVLLTGVIEGASDPMRLLRDVRKVLTPGGTICVDTPNWGSFWRRWGGSAWMGFNHRQTNLFDAGSLLRILASCGFQDVAASSYAHYRYERWSSRPEIRSWVQRLPEIVSGRLGRFLENRHPTTRWSRLRDGPPGSADIALQCLAESCAADDGRPSAALNGDYLAFTARR